MNDRFNISTHSKITLKNSGYFIMTTRHCSNYLFLYSSQLSSNICFNELAKESRVTHTGHASDDKIDSLLYTVSRTVFRPRGDSRPHFPAVIKRSQ